MSLWDIRFGPSEPTPEESQRRVDRITKILLGSLAEEKTMGNWVIHIEGTGAHHNGNPASDANEKAKEFVYELQGIGQNVESATFTSGSRDSVLPPKTEG